MINVLIFSKDRAAQLDLTLTTLKKYFKEWDQQKYNIIYKYSNSLYNQGYEKLKQIHNEPCFNWILENNFTANTVKAIFDSNHPYASFLVDDDVFVDYFSWDDQEIQYFVNNDDILCVSPRLAPYVNYCYTQNAPQPQPRIRADKTWEWIGANHDWGYPMSIASFHIFRNSDIKKIVDIHLKRGIIITPNHLEGIWLAASPPTNRKLMICFEQAKCICSTNNKVQNVNNNRNENTDPIDYLNTQFLQGKRLDPDANHQVKLNMCHGPLKYVWR